MKHVKGSVPVYALRLLYVIYCFDAHTSRPRALVDLSLNGKVISNIPEAKVIILKSLKGHSVFLKLSEF